jgi:acyl-coenzyme A synthetase/AMP-(fatty) acid ligase
MMLIDLLLNHPNGDHIVYRGTGVVTVRDLQTMCQSTARSLRDMNVGPGDRVVLIGNDSAEWAATFWALVLLGAHAVILHANMPQEHVNNVIKKHRVKLVCTDQSRFDDVAVFDIKSKVKSNIGQPIAPFDHKSNTLLSWPSSGTNGTFKLIEHTNASLCAATMSLDNYASSREVHRGDVIFCGAKMSFGLGWLFNVLGCLHLHITSVIGTGLAELRSFSAIAEKHQVQHVVVTPYILDIIHRTSMCLPDSVRTICTSAEPLPDRLIADIKQKFSIDVTNIYGLCELFIVTMADQDRSSNSAGKVVNGVNYRLISDDGNVIGLTGCGILQIKSGSQFVGYLDDPESTRQVLRDGWVHTNDMVDVLEDGEVIFLGRANSCIKVKGHWVSLLEIEQAISQISGINDCVVVKSTDSQGFDSISAFVVVDNNSDLRCVDTIRDRLRRDLGKKYLMPSDIYLIDEIPRTVNLKKLRNISAMNQWLEQRNMI